MRLFGRIDTRILAISGLCMIFSWLRASVSPIERRVGFDEPVEWRRHQPALLGDAVATQTPGNSGD